jgi:hypothetical protein
MVQFSCSIEVSVLRFSLAEQGAVSTGCLQGVDDV